MYKKYETVTNDGYSLVDNMTGEIKEFKQVRKVSYDDFILVFLQTMPEMYKLNGNQLKILMCCWRQSTFNPRTEAEGNMVYNNAAFKEAVRQSGLELSDIAIDVYLSNLAKLEFLIKVCRGQYMLNPKYFFKGTASDASKLSLTITT